MGDMDDRENPEHIERMLNVMTLVPASDEDVADYL